MNSPKDPFTIGISLVAEDKEKHEVKVNVLLSGLKIKICITGGIVLVIIRGIEL